MYYLGIDAGGSKCAARLCGADGKILGEGLSGCANMRTGIVSVFTSLQDAYTQAVNQAIEQAGLDSDCVGKIVAGAGIAGISRKGALDLLQAQDFPFRSIRFASDAQIANIGAHSGRDGGIVIVGTGSIGIGQIGDRQIQVGGYGFPVSDEGSGAWIGLQAIRMVLRAADGRLAHSDLTLYLLKKYGFETSEIVRWMDTATATDYAALAPLVVKTAGDNDIHGYEIIQQAANHIEVMINSLYKSGVPRIALCGGLSTSLKPWLSPTISAKLVKPKGHALDGALWLARQK